MNFTSSNGYQTPKMQQIPDAKIACDDYAMTLHQYVYGHNEHLFLFSGIDASEKKVRQVFEFYDWVTQTYRKCILPTVIVTAVPAERNERNVLLDIDAEIYSVLNKKNETLLILFHRDKGILHIQGHSVWDVWHCLLSR